MFKGKLEDNFTSHMAGNFNITESFLFFPYRKLTKEDMERKRRQMMENAKWRDEQREKNVKTYKERDEREEAQMKEEQARTSGADFIK